MNKCNSHRVWGGWVMQDAAPGPSSTASVPQNPAQLLHQHRYQQEAPRLTGGRHQLWTPSKEETPEKGQDENCRRTELVLLLSVPWWQQSEKCKARFSAAEVHNSFNCPSAIPLKGSTQHCWRGNPSNLVEWKPLLIIFLLSWWTLFHSRIETLWTCMGSRSQLSSTLREPGQSCKELLVPLCPLLSFRRPQIPSLGGNLCRINKSFTSLLFASMWIWLSSLDKNVLKQLWTLLSSCGYD